MLLWRYTLCSHPGLAMQYTNVPLPSVWMTWKPEYARPPHLIFCKSITVITHSSTLSIHPVAALLKLVLISHPTEGRRLSWPTWAHSRLAKSDWLASGKFIGEIICSVMLSSTCCQFGNCCCLLNCVHFGCVLFKLVFSISLLIDWIWQQHAVTLLKAIFKRHATQALQAVLR